MSGPQPKYLFDCLEEVWRQVAAYERSAVFFDLDGTLAPITSSPQATRMMPDVRAALERLTLRHRYQVAIVSGRSIDNLRRLVGMPGLLYSGNHGLEISGPGLSFVHREAAECGALVAHVCARVQSQLQSVRGVIVEFKGLTGSVHYRLVAPSLVHDVRAVVFDAVAPFTSRLEVFEGKRVLEVKPAVQWNKGSAVIWMMNSLGFDLASAIYIGDDRTDEDAFAVMPQGITINVGSDLGMTSARYFVRGPEGVLILIQYLSQEENGTYVASEGSLQSFIRPSVEDARKEVPFKHKEGGGSR